MFPVDHRKRRRSIDRIKDLLNLLGRSDATRSSMIGEKTGTRLYLDGFIRTVGAVLSLRAYVHEFPITIAPCAICRRLVQKYYDHYRDHHGTLTVAGSALTLHLLRSSYRMSHVMHPSMYIRHAACETGESFPTILGVPELFSHLFCCNFFNRSWTSVNS